jgi:glycosyltransferase involved in cell wall biosynthesis
MQEGDFEYEIVIGEDCSTDNTRTILLDYQARHPSKIRLLLAEKNQGLVRNFIDTYRACKGEYVATLDGDDFWTSPRKLRTQVEFLDSRRDFSMCFHPVTEVFDDGSKPSRIYPQLAEETYSLEDLLQNNCIPTCSVMFRNGVFGEFPDWYRSFTFMEDWALYALIAEHGKIGFLNEAMGVYRFHSNSTWYSMDQVTRCQEELKFYDHIKQHLGRKYHPIIEAMLERYYYKLALLYEDNNCRDNAKKYIYKSVYINPLFSQVKFINKIKTIFRLNSPVLYRFISAIIHSK